MYASRILQVELLYVGDDRLRDFFSVAPTTRSYWPFT